MPGVSPLSHTHARSRTAARSSTISLHVWAVAWKISEPAIYAWRFRVTSCMAWAKINRIVPPCSRATLTVAKMALALNKLANGEIMVARKQNWQHYKLVAAMDVKLSAIDASRMKKKNYWASHKNRRLDVQILPGSRTGFALDAQAIERVLLLVSKASTKRSSFEREITSLCSCTNTWR
jgi:hypothetical protein